MGYIQDANKMFDSEKYSTRIAFISGALDHHVQLKINGAIA
jgi:hypothetical protein